jgi:hypothetical protein
MTQGYTSESLRSHSATILRTVASAGRQVKLSLTMPMSLADFNSNVQHTLRETLAVAAGLTKPDAWRVGLTARAARRRLLAAAVAVDVVISMPDTASASKAVASLTQDSINKGLVAAGLPAATVTTPPVLSFAGTSTASDRPAALPATALGGAVLGLLAGLRLAAPHPSRQ